MAEKFKIAIVGAGPAGLSAGVRAAQLGVSHVLLEASPHIANTVHHFQKGKLVMAEPAQLPRRSTLSFTAGTREAVLESWRRQAVQHAVQLRTGAGVTAIAGRRGDFTLTLVSGVEIKAEVVVLAIGVQGNIRTLGVPGEHLPGVLYQLDDPEQFHGETILVVGGGDAGVENALALAQHNRVILFNRQEEFTNCHEANFDQLREAVKAGRIETRVSTSVLRVETRERGVCLVVQSPRGTERIDGDRLIARLGATPPRQTVERFGVRFPNDDPMAVPQLSEQNESNVPGLYIVGALAGYPLIKQALNQGYEVVEHIVGNPVEPADEAILQAKFSRVAGLARVADGIELLRRTQPLLASLTTLQLREFMLDSEVHVPRAGEIIFRGGDYGNSFFSVLQGAVEIHIPRQDGQMMVFPLPTGDFFGEMGLLSGRRRSGTVIAGEGSVLVETPRRSMLRLLDSAPSVQRRLDEVSLKRIVRNGFGASLSSSQLDELVHQAQVKRYGVGEALFQEGDEPDGLYMIRRGSVTVSRRIDGKEVISAYVSAGNYVGEMALCSKTKRTATVRAAAPTEAMLLESARFLAVLEQYPVVRGEIAGRYLERVRANESVALGQNSEFIQFLIDQGVGEATDVLLIDLTKCIRCNNCEQACAQVHDGTSRLRREAGRTHELIHVPSSCRHCEHPRCMKDCPADAIHRAPGGEVVISETCIGCGNCQTNCPYGVIRMASEADYRRPSLLDLLLGRQPASGGDGEAAAEKRAVKCDMCLEIVGGAACVRACPTGAAFRVRPDQFLALAGQSS